MFLAIVILGIAGVFILGLLLISLFYSAALGSESANNIIGLFFWLLIIGGITWAAWYVFRFPLPHLTWS